MTTSAFHAAGDYAESRSHTYKRRRVVMVDGNLVANETISDSGLSSRVFKQGYWGFAAAAAGKSQVDLTNQALANTDAMQVFGPKKLILPNESYQGEHRYTGLKSWTSAELIEWQQQVTDFARKKFAKLKSITVIGLDENHEKGVQNSLGANCVNSIDRALVYLRLTAEDADGKPVEIMESINGKGGLGNLDLSMTKVESTLDELYTHLMAKTEAVTAQGGLQTVVLDPALAGMLAHEAMGHPCEADLVLGGAVTGDLRGQTIASPLISMVDYANHYNGEELLMPVYADDEGTPSKDVTLIDKGVLTDFMNNRETAAVMSDTPTGNARAYAPQDEPLIRMRNTAILPGTSKFKDMIADVEDGYYLVKTGNGQADTTTEFMFSVTLAYEIKNGQLGRAIKDTTVSGSAIKMLQSVDAVSDDMQWENSGYCGKKQIMVVSMGGPAIRAKIQMGGE